MEGAAIAGDFLERARLADDAGCDMLLVCNNPKAAEQVLDGMRFSPSSDRQRRLRAMLGQPQFDTHTLFSSERWQNLSNKITSLCA